MEKKNQHQNKILGILVSTVFILLIFWKIDLHQLFATFKGFDFRAFLIFVPVYLLGIYIRGARWKYLLCNDKKLSVNEAFFSFTAGNTLNSYLPARAGDFWRAVHVGNKIGESKMKLLGSIILERIIDGISVLLILYTAILLYFKHQKVIEMAIFSAILFFGAFIFFFVLFKTGKITDIFEWFKKLPFLNKNHEIINKLSGLSELFMNGFSVLNDPKCFWGAFFMSMIAWMLECFVTYVLISGFGLEIGFSSALFVISFVALSTVIPSSSVFIGPYQFAYILALGIYHVSKSQALAVAFVHQIIIMILITIITVIYFACVNTSMKEISEEIKSGEEN